MNCEEVRAQLHLYLDAALDDDSRNEIEEHLHACSACHRLYAQQISLHAHLKSHAPDFDAPEDLQRRIMSRVSAAAEEEPDEASKIAKPKPNRWFNAWGLVAICCLVVTLALGWLIHAREMEVEEFKDEAVAAHQRSLLVDHLVDVRTSDPDHLAAWFDAYLPFRVTIKDLAPQGFKLVGGRLEYLYAQLTAAAVYQANQHVINVLMWPASSSDNLPTDTMSDENLHIRLAKLGDVNYCAISDVEPGELERFIYLLTGRR